LEFWGEVRAVWVAAAILWGGDVGLRSRTIAWWYSGLHARSLSLPHATGYWPQQQRAAESCRKSRDLAQGWSAQPTDYSQRCKCDAAGWVHASRREGWCRAGEVRMWQRRTRTATGSSDSAATYLLQRNWMRRKRGRRFSPNIDLIERRQRGCDGAACGRRSLTVTSSPLDDVQSLSQTFFERGRDVLQDTTGSDALVRWAVRSFGTR
jgi:hypothetical protein